MNGDNRVDVLRVAAAHDHGDGEAALATGVENAAISLAQSFDRQREASQSVAFVRVGAREIKHEIRRVSVEHPREIQ